VAESVFGTKDNGASVQLPRSAKITIELEENPTTGYRWMISSIDEAFLVPEGDAFLTGDRMAPGAGGLRRFFLSHKGTGPHRVELDQQTRVATRRPSGRHLRTGDSDNKVNLRPPGFGNR
jgi:predicted secreted protein